MAATLIGRRILLNKNNICKIPKRNGYFVLLPEIGEDLPDKNPLLKEDTKLPEFNKLTIANCIAVIGKQSIEVEQGVRNIEEQLKEGIQDEEVFEKIIEPIEELNVPLETTCGVAKTMYLGNQTLMPTRLFTNINERSTKGRLCRFQSQLIFNACKKAFDNNDIKLNQEQHQVLYKYILEGKLNGLDLEKKDALLYSFEEINNEQTLYNKKFMTAQKNFQRTISDPLLVRDFPESFLAILARDPSQPREGPWTVKCDPYILPTFLEYCPDPFLRFKVWEANVSMCSMQDERNVQTSVNIEGIRINRNKYAQALGFKSYSEMSMETKMAGSLDNVYNVINTLYETARPCQEVEIENLTQFAAERGFERTLNEWDIPYWSRKQLRSDYMYDEEALREYFPLSNVLKGLYKICENLFNIKIVEERRVDVWHKDVRFFDVFDLNESSSEPIASFYLDPYSRTEDKKMIPGSITTIKYKSTITQDNPLLALIFNFQAPSQDAESLLTFKDVIDLFQKFGYALRNLLLKTNYYDTTNPIEWDAFAITSYFMENRLYEPSTIKLISKHFKTGESLSDELIKKLVNIRLHMAGYKLCKQMYLSELDLKLHSEDKEFWMPLSKKLWNKYFVLPMHKSNEHLCSFRDIFTGEWGAAYYCNLWSNMTAADAYSAFHEISQNDENQVREVGKRFRETFLAYGGSYPMNEVFRKFRGRDPSPLALLNSLNLRIPKLESNKHKVEDNLKADLIE